MGWLALQQRKLHAADQISLHGEFRHFFDIVPPHDTVIVGLNPLRPFEQRHGPSHLHRPRCIRANRLGICTEINVGITSTTIPALLRSSRSQVIIQFAEVANSPGVQRAASPPTASLDVRPPQLARYHIPLLVHDSTSDVGIVRRRIVVSRDRLIGRSWRAFQRGRSVALEGGLGCGGYFHVRIDVALIHFFRCRAGIGGGFGVGNSALSAGVAQGIESVGIFAVGIGKDHFPVEFVAGIIQNHHGHTLTQKSRHIRQPNMPSIIITIIRTHVKVPLSSSPHPSIIWSIHAHPRHPFQTGTKIIVQILSTGSCHIFVVVRVALQYCILDGAFVIVEVGEDLVYDFGGGGCCGGG
mmetsp:Transcript_15554/g.28282  ORF Transcript_15554/g.28282 Transcript_15554/m.28282 type:complete len:354 (+) Transcript_15554:3064-4125(+)